MAETTTANTTQKAKVKSAAATATAAMFEMPKFEMPKFDIPNLDVPAAFREITEKSLAQAKDNYEKMKSVTEEATDVLEDTYSTASKGCSAYGLKLIENARANTDASFTLMTALFGAKSYAEAVELTSGFMRSQFETLTAQAKDLAETAQKVCTESAEPMKEGFTTAFKKVA